jgi:hypothetical protein
MIRRNVVLVWKILFGKSFYHFAGESFMPLCGTLNDENSLSCTMILGCCWEEDRFPLEP